MARCRRAALRRGVGRRNLGVSAGGGANAAAASPAEWTADAGGSRGQLRLELWPALGIRASPRTLSALAFFGMQMQHVHHVAAKFWGGLVDKIVGF